MKTIAIQILIAILAILAPFAIQAQTQETKTLLRGDFKLTGWFVEVPAVYAEVVDRDVFFNAISGGVIFNENFRVGVSGRSYTNRYNRIKLDFVDEGRGGYLEGYEYGIHLEPVIWNKEVVHLTFPVMLGVGYAELSANRQMPDEDNELDNIELEKQQYLVVNPSMHVELNIHKNIRLAGGVGYRFTSERELNGVPGDLSGLMANLSIKVGKF